MASPTPRPGHIPSRATLLKDCPSDYKIAGSRLQRPTTPDRVSRSSFSSTRETETGLTQTFSSSKVSSYLYDEEAVVVDSHTPAQGANNMIQTQFHPPVTLPHSKLHGYWSPAESFRGWKEINVRGKLASKSFGDLQSLSGVWSTEACPVRPKDCFPPGRAPFEQLPIELLSSVINLLVLDIPPGGLARRNVDLMSLLLTSRTLYSATLGSLYHKITIPHSRIFQKFLCHIADNPVLGTIVRRLDFCHFNPAQLFLTGLERSQARNLTSETLLRCLELTPHLHEFLAQEHIDDDIDANVLRKLFVGLPSLQAVDFCGCSSTAFKDAFTTVMTTELPMELSITRISFHKCLTLPSSVFESLLPRLPRITHLDVAGTCITDKALASIPPMANLTHLNLAKCRRLSARMVIDFLAGHPAVARKLTFLSLATDATSHQLLDIEDVTELLPLLPRTLRSLSLKGSKMEASHIDLLRPLTKHLEELALGRCLKIEDINRLFIPDEDKNELENHLDWVPHSLKYIDLSDMWGAELDLVFLFGSQSAILTRFSEPLDVVEVAGDIFRRLQKSPAPLTRAGWRVSECGSRAWMVRSPSRAAVVKDDGHRGWKMGADNWGMRKIPVAQAEVGGMYGSFMFARKL